MGNVVIVNGKRTPFGSFGGSLIDVTNIKLGAMAIKETLKDYARPEDIDQLVMEPITLDSWFHESPIKILYEVVESGMKDRSIRNDLSVPALANTLWAQTMGVLQVIKYKKEVFELLEISAEEVILCHYELLLNGVKNKTIGS